MDGGVATLCLLLLASGALFCGCAAPETDIDPSAYAPHHIKRDWRVTLHKQLVDRRPWGLAEDINALFSAHNARPVVLYNTPVDALPIMRWSPEELRRRLGRRGDRPQLQGVKIAPENEHRFLYHVLPSGLTSYPGWRSAYESSAMTALQFFDRAANGNQSLQFSSSLRGLELTALAQDLHANAADYIALAAADQWTHPALKNFNGKPKGELATSESAWSVWRAVNPMIWLGAGNATTTLHYDTAHNTYIQLHGRKRFLLIEPRQPSGINLVSMPTFPHAHPSNRQARWASARPLEKVTGTATGASVNDPGLYDIALQALGHADVVRAEPDQVAQQATGTGADHSYPQLVILEAVLEKGDVLFLPAHWLHYVEAVNSPRSNHMSELPDLPPAERDMEAADMSVSMNLWTPSKEELVLNAMMAPPQPWPDGINLQAETLCVQLLLKTLLTDSAPVLQRYLHVPFAERLAVSLESTSGTGTGYGVVSDTAPKQETISSDGASRKGRRARQKQKQHNREKSGQTTQASSPPTQLTATESDEVVAAFLRQMLSRKGYDLEQEQIHARPHPPYCVSPAELQSTVVSSGMPKEWAQAIVQRAKRNAQVVLQSASSNAPDLPLMQAETVGVHIESYIEVYARNLLMPTTSSREQETDGSWLLSVGPFLRDCVCGPACSSGANT